MSRYSKVLVFFTLIFVAVSYSVYGIAMNQDTINTDNSDHILTMSPNDCDSSSYIDRFSEVYEGHQISWPVTYGQCGYSPIDINSDWYATMSRPVSVNATNNSQVGLPPGSTLPYAHVVWGQANTSFNWTPSYCQARALNETYYNTSSNTTRKYNYHYRELYWTDGGFPYQYPHHIVARKIAVYDVDRAPIVNTAATYDVRSGTSVSRYISLYDPDEFDCGIAEDFIKSVKINSTHGEVNLTKVSNFTYRLSFNSTMNDLVCHNFTLNVTDNKNSSTVKSGMFAIYAPLEMNGIGCSYAARGGRDSISIKITVPYNNMSYQTCDLQNVSIGSTVSFVGSNGWQGTLPIINNTAYFNWGPGSGQVGTYTFTFTLKNSLNESSSKSTKIQVLPKLYPNNLPSLVCAIKSEV
jgi:hypothetical protein